MISEPHPSSRFDESWKFNWINFVRSSKVGCLFIGSTTNTRSRQSALFVLKAIRRRQIGSLNLITTMLYCLDLDEYHNSFVYVFFESQSGSFIFHVNIPNIACICLFFNRTHVWDLILGLNGNYFFLGTVVEILQIL